MPIAKNAYFYAVNSAAAYKRLAARNGVAGGPGPRPRLNLGVTLLLIHGVHYKDTGGPVIMEQKL